MSKPIYENDILLVGINSERVLRFDPQQPKPRSIGTVLLGCTALAAIFRNRHNDLSVLIAHYSPLALGRMTGRLGKTIQHEVGTGYNLARAALLTSGEWRKNVETGRYELHPSSSPEIDALANSVQQAAGSEQPVERIAYSQKIRSLGGMDAQGLLAVTFHPDAEQGYWLFVEGTPR